MIKLSARVYVSPFHGRQQSLLISPMLPCHQERKEMPKKRPHNIGQCPLVINCAHQTSLIRDALKVRE